jgi:hypothetical protein
MNEADPQSEKGMNVAFCTIDWAERHFHLIASTSTIAILGHNEVFSATVTPAFAA